MYHEIFLIDVNVIMLNRVRKADKDQQVMWSCLDNVKIVLCLYAILIQKVFIVRLAGDHLYGKVLFTWLSLVMSIMVSYCAVLFPTRCLG